VDERFEEVDGRFQQMMAFKWIPASIFTALTIAVRGFAYGDRRTIIRRAKRETMEVMRQVAVKDSNVAEAMRRFNLL
jgi:hypothetical protein